jgi:hypothetical protein
LVKNVTQNGLVGYWYELLGTCKSEGSKPSSFSAAEYKCFQIDPPILEY